MEDAHKLSKLALATFGKQLYMMIAKSAQDTLYAAAAATHDSTWDPLW